MKIRTLTPGAKAPRRTAVAEDTSPASDPVFRFSILQRKLKLVD